MIIVTHIDLDGAGCALVAKHFYNEQIAQIIHCDYDIVDTVVTNILTQTTESILIADVSMNAKTAAMIQEEYPNRIELFDHHKSVISYLQQYSWAHIDITQCATKLLFQILLNRHSGVTIPPHLRKLVFHVNDYDLWIHESPQSAIFNNMLSLLGVDLFVKTMYSRLYENQPLIRENDQLYLDGLAIKNENYFKQRVQQAIVIDNRLVVLVTHHTSELAQYIRDISPAPESWKNVAYIDMINLENRSHSLRSYDPNFDVSQVAIQHGGGGHKHAAGYSFSPSTDINQLLTQL